METLHFVISGDFVTSTAREYFYTRGNLQAAIDLLMCCTLSDQLSEEQHIQLCLDILAGSRAITGVSGTEDYGLCTDDKAGTLDFERTMAKYLGIYHIARSKKDYAASPDAQFDLRKVFEYVERKHLVDKQTYLATSHNYGWLAPNGKFYPVDWGEHGAWAREYLFKHYDEATHPEIYGTAPANLTLWWASDTLVYKLGWVLLHSPGNNEVQVDYNKAGHLSKAQREFLYDYFAVRNHMAQARLFLGE